MNKFNPGCLSKASRDALEERERTTLRRVFRPPLKCMSNVVTPKLQVFTPGVIGRLGRAILFCYDLRLVVE